MPARESRTEGASSVVGGAADTTSPPASAMLAISFAGFAAFIWWRFVRDAQAEQAAGHPVASGT